MFNSFDLRMFAAAKSEAEKSTFNRFKVGAVITYKNRIIGQGHNSDKTDPMQQRYNSLYRDFNNADGAYIKHSIHAEVAAIKSISFIVGKEVDFSKCNIYVYRICNGRPNGYGCSKPCPACAHALKDIGIHNVYFTDNYGLSYLRLD